jgi:hypothetical protein
MTRPVFRPTTRRLVVLVVTLSFLFSLVLGILGPELLPISSNEADAYSVSALGHAALVELLRSLDIPTFVSTWESGRRAARSGLLMVLAPDRFIWNQGWQADVERGRRLQSLDALMATADRVLVSLPKWKPTQNEENENWIGGVHADRGTATNVLQALGIEATLEQEDWTGTWRMNGMGPTPNLPDLQLMRSADLDPIIECEAGILLGETRNARGARLLVLSDPDLFATHGLKDADNAVLAVRIIEHLRRGGGVVVDEIAHGHSRRPSAWARLLRFPLVLLVLHGLIGMGILLWMSVGRFGRPLKARPVFEAGSRDLVRNTAALMRTRGNLGGVSRRYLQDRLAAVRRALRVPHTLRGAELSTWLDRIGRARKTTHPFSELAERTEVLASSHHPDPRRVLDLAHEIHTWEQEITYGTRSRT